MRAIAIAVAIVALAVPAIGGQSDRAIEVGGDAILFGNVDGAGEFLDAVVVRVSAASWLRDGISLGPVLSYRYQEPADGWQPFAPAGAPGIHPDRSSDGGGVDRHAAFYEVTLRARALDRGGRLRPFTELEGGFAVIDDGDGAAADVVVAVRTGIAWRPRTDLTVLLGVGQRFYLATERYTLPLALDVGWGF